MTIKEFCEKFETIPNMKEEKIAFVKDNVKFNDYVPYNRKVTYAKELARVSVFNKDGRVEINSTVHVLFLYRLLITMYTDLVVENSSFYEEYDCLKKSGAFKYIINEMGSEDVNEFIDLCDMVLNDMIKNVNSSEAFVRENVKVIGNILSDMLRPYIGDFITEMKRADKDDLNMLISLLVEVIKQYQK